MHRSTPLGTSAIFSPAWFPYHNAMRLPAKSISIRILSHSSNPSCVPSPTFLSLGYPSRPPGGSVSCERSRSRRRSSRWSRCLVIDCVGLIGRSIAVVPGSSLLRTSRLIAVGIVVSCFSLPVLTRRGLVRGRTSWVFEVAAAETATWLPG